MIDERNCISVEKGTAKVPDDGRFHVLVDNEIVLSTRVEAAALAEFEDVKARRDAERSKKREQLRGETAYRLMRGESWAQKSSRDIKRGRQGPGR